MSAKSKSLAEIKSDVCNTTLWVMSLLIVPALAVSLLRAVELGWRPQYAAQVVACLVAWTVTIGRRRFSYLTRANTILLLLFWLAWTGQVASPAPTSLVFFVSAAAMAAVFYGTRAGVIAIIAAGVTTLSSYFGFKYGVYAEPASVPTLMVTTWLSRAASIVVAAAGPVIAVSQLRRSLTAELLQAAAANDAKSNFLAMMSHELRTPMTAIIGIAELLQSEAMPQDQAGKVARIATSSKSLMTLLNDLLDFAKIEANQMTIENAAFSLRELLADVSGLFSSLAEEKGIMLTINVAPGAHDALIGDASRIRQIVQNLTGNAIKFTDKGAVAIDVAQTKIDASRLMLRIAVSDTGIGIRPEDQGRLFKPFVQAEAVASRKHGGTGLGLAISRQLAELLHGRLTLESKPGDGSTFALELPVGIAAEVAATSRAQELAPAKRSLRLLVVDDNEPIRHLMQAMLGKRGHGVELAENGAEAVSLASTRPYDAILLDMHMPVMDGLEAAKTIRAFKGPQARVPIIALTAGLTESQRASYLAAGVDQVAGKPAHWPSLFGAIETLGESFQDSNRRTSSENALDAEVVGALQAAVGEDTMSRLLVGFRSSVSGYDRDLRAALSDRNLKAAKRAAHGLKGTCRQFGAHELGNIADAMDQPEATLEEIRAEIAKVAPAVARLDAALGAKGLMAPSA